MKNLFKKLMLGLGIICMSFTMVACGNDNAGGGQSPKQEQGTGESGGSQGGSTGGSESGGQGEKETAQDIANNEVYNKLKTARDKTLNPDNYTDYTFTVVKNDSFTTKLNKAESKITWLPTYTDDQTVYEKNSRDSEFLESYETKLNNDNVSNHENKQDYFYSYNNQLQTGNSVYKLTNNFTNITDEIMEATVFTTLGNGYYGDNYFYSYDYHNGDPIYRKSRIINDDYLKGAITHNMDEVIAQKEELFSYKTYKELIKNYNFGGVEGICNINISNKNISYKNDNGVYTLTAKINGYGQLYSPVAVLKNADVNIELEIVFDENGLKSISTTNITKDKEVIENLADDRIASKISEATGTIVKNYVWNRTEKIVFSNTCSDTVHYNFDIKSCTDVGTKTSTYFYYVDGLLMDSNEITPDCKFVEFNIDPRTGGYNMEKILKSGFVPVWYTDPECTKPYTFPETMPGNYINLYTKSQNLKLDDTAIYVEWYSIDLAMEKQDVTADLIESLIKNKSNCNSVAVFVDDLGVVTPSTSDYKLEYVNGTIYYKGEEFQIMSGKKNILVTISLYPRG